MASTGAAARMGAGALQVNRRNLFLAMVGAPLAAIGVKALAAAASSIPAQLPIASPVTSITINGVILSKDAARQIAEALKEVIDNDDVHLIGANSSQARAIRGEFL
jgi:hypothetical protein